jgi:hypothetical protein
LSGFFKPPLIPAPFGFADTTIEKGLILGGKPFPTSL